MRQPEQKPAKQKPRDRARWPFRLAIQFPPAEVQIVNVVHPPLPLVILKEFCAG